MIKRFCDRCKTVMDDGEPLSHIDGYCIVKAKSGCPDANNPWKVLDLCPRCLESFSSWMKNPEKDGSVAPEDFIPGSGGYGCYKCECGALLVEGQQYCSTCGKKVVWYEPQTDQ